jgi:hypothetical protein
MDAVVHADGSRTLLAHPRPDKFDPHVWPRAITEQGDVIGSADWDEPDGTVERAVKWVGGWPIELNLFGDVQSEATAIAEDGTVASAMPIYASGGGSKAIAFARKAMNWSWDAEEVKKIRPFFRSAIRLEMRCTNEPELDSVSTLLIRDVEAWATAQGFGYPLDKRDVGPADYASARAELASREKAHGPDAAALVPLLVRISGDRSLPLEEQLAVDQRGLRIARTVHAPAATIALFGMAETDHQVRIAWNQQIKNGMSGDRRWATADYSSVLALPEVARDPRVSAAVRLAGARAVVRSDKAKAQNVLEEANLPASRTADPIIETARANLAALKGEKVAPLAGVGDSGCPLSEAIGPMVRSGASSDDFPKEAITWGFEGWATIEMSVTPDGKVVGPRTLIAHPPFVFGKAAEKMTIATRYLPPAVPLSGNCAVSRMTIRFRMQ